MRSIMPAIGAHRERRDVQREPPVGHEVGVRHDLADQRADVDEGPVGLGDPAVQPFQVEEVADHPIEASGVLGDPVCEIA